MRRSYTYCIFSHVNSIVTQARAESVKSARMPPDGWSFNVMNTAAGVSARCSDETSFRRTFASCANGSFKRPFMDRATCSHAAFRASRSSAKKRRATKTALVQLLAAQPLQARRYCNEPHVRRLILAYLIDLRDPRLSHGFVRHSSHRDQTHSHCLDSPGRAVRVVPNAFRARAHPSPTPHNTITDPRFPE